MKKQTIGILKAVALAALVCYPVALAYAAVKDAVSNDFAGGGNINVIGNSKTNGSLEGAPGIAGLLAGLQFVMKKGIEKILEQERLLIERLIAGLKKFPGVTIYGPENGKQRIATLSFTIEGYTPSEVSTRLEREFSVLCRPGLHCAPAAHRTLGTFPDGTIRFSLGAFNTEDEINCVINAVSEISKGSGRA